GVQLGPGQYIVEQRLALLVDDVRSPGPATVESGMTVSRGHRRIRHKHGVAAGNSQPRTPAPAPRVVRAMRTAVDPQHHRRGILDTRMLGHTQPPTDRDAVGLGAHPLHTARKITDGARGCYLVHLTF